MNAVFAVSSCTGSIFDNLFINIEAVVLKSPVSAVIFLITPVLATIFFFLSVQLPFTLLLKHSFGDYEYYAEGKIKMTKDKPMTKRTDRILA